MNDRGTLAQMNVAICRALGMDPRGITNMVVRVARDELPKIEVTYSARYIAELTKAMGDGYEIESEWEWQLVPKMTETTTIGDEHATYTPAQPHPEGMAGLVRPPTNGTPPPRWPMVHTPGWMAWAGRSNRAMGRS